MVRKYGSFPPFKATSAPIERKALSGVNLDTNEDIGAEITSGLRIVGLPNQKILAVSSEETTGRLSVGRC